MDLFVIDKDNDKIIPVSNSTVSLVSEAQLPDIYRLDYTNNQGQVIKVVLHGYTGVQQYTFQNYSYLQEIQLGEAVERIEYGAFQSTNSLSTISFPSTLYYIDNYAFSNSGLTTLTLPEGVQELGAGAFAYNYNLQTIHLPSSLEKLGQIAFVNSPCEQNSVLPGTNFSVVDGWLLNNQTGLSGDIIVPSEITGLCGSAFRFASQISSVTFSGNLTAISEDCFYQSAIKDFSFSSDITTIYDSAFYECTIDSINHISNIQTAGTNCFYDCTWNCGDITFNFLDDIPSYFMSHATLNNAVISFPVANLVEYDAFISASDINIALGTNVSYIGSNAFSYASGILTINTEAASVDDVPELDWQDDLSNLTIYVPDNSITYYKQATNWSDWESQIHPISEKTGV